MEFLAHPEYLKEDIPPIEVDGPIWCEMCRVWFSSKTGKDWIWKIGA